MSVNRELLERILSGHRPSGAELSHLSEHARTGDLMAIAAAVRDEGHGDIVTYSPKVFLPITHLCRDVCHYCTFARTPREVNSLFMSLENALDVAASGAAAGCREALFTLGDKPELRYPAAREWLSSVGHDTTLSYVAHVAKEVAARTGLLPHVKIGRAHV